MINFDGYMWQQRVYKIWAAAVNNVLGDILKRQAEPDELEKVTLQHIPSTFNKYDFFFAGEHLGYIEMPIHSDNLEMPYKDGMSITFHPSPEYILKKQEAMIHQEIN